MAYSGRYRLKNPHKYKGNPNNVIWRSTWELKFLRYLDEHPNIIEFSSEEIVIPYLSPIDEKYHRYFVDFMFKVRTKDNKIKQYLVEIKPHCQTVEPKKPKRITESYINAVKTYLVNSAKWTAAKEWAAKHGIEFVVITEEHLFLKNK